MRTHFKQPETFQFTFFTSCHPPGVKKGFVKGEALRLLRTNSSITKFEENITKYKKTNTLWREAPHKMLLTTLSQKWSFNKGHKPSSNEKGDKKKPILPFKTQYPPAVPNLKEILTRKWYLILQQPLLNPIFKEPPIISYRKGDSLKDIHITKARKPNHVFPSRVGLSTHINTLLTAEPFNCVKESSFLAKVLEMRNFTLPWLLCLRLRQYRV